MGSLRLTEPHKGALAKQPVSRLDVRRECGIRFEVSCCRKGQTMMNRDTPRSLAAIAVLFAALGVTSAAHAVSEQDRKAGREQLTQAQDLKKQVK